MPRPPPPDRLLVPVADDVAAAPPEQLHRVQSVIIKSLYSISINNEAKQVDFLNLNYQ